MKRKMYPAGGGVVILLLLAFLIAGCGGTESPAPTPPANGTLQVDLSFADPDLDISPEVNSFSQVVLSFSDDAHEDVIIPLGSGAPVVEAIELPPGEWTVTASYYIGDSVVAEDVQSVTVVSGEASGMEIFPEPKSGANGTFNYDFTFPGFIDSGELIINGSDGNPVAGSPVDIKANSGEGSISLAPGKYAVTTVLARGDKRGGDNWDLYVYSGQTSAVAKEYNDEDFNNTITLGFDLTSLVTVPVRALPISSPSIDTEQYTGSVEWQNEAGGEVSGAFGAGTVYRAEFTLTAKESFTFIGIGANAFSYTDAASVANSANSGTVIVTFPATEAMGDNIVITIGFNNSPTLAGGDGKNIIYKANGKSVLYLYAEGYDAVEWYIDGSDTAAGTSALLEIKASDITQVGQHSVSFIGTRDGSVYAEAVPFTVMPDGNEYTGPVSWTPREGYLNTPLDPSQPVAFYGNEVGWNDSYWTLGEKTFYIDGSFTDGDIARFRAEGYNFVFNDFVEAFRTSAAEGGIPSNGTAAEPVTVLIAPWVYWTNNPDVPQMISPAQGILALGTRPYMRLIGLNDNYDNVVIAAQRGQMAGSQGNFTMISGTWANAYFKNISISNYVNFDLDFPLKPELGRPKRQENITQSQIWSGSLNYLVAENCRFSSKHNAMPPSGTPTIYYKCRIDGGAHSLPMSATCVYLESDVHLWNSQNGGSTGNVALLGCDIYLDGDNPETSFGDGLGSGNAAVINCNVISPDSSRQLIWNRNVMAGTPYNGYQYNVRYNGVPGYIIDPDRPGVTGDLTGKEALKAYLFEYGGEEYYNTYDLLKRYNDWDYFGIKEAAVAAGAIDVPRSITASIVDDQSMPATTGTEILGSNESEYKILQSSGENVVWDISPRSQAIASNAVVTVVNNEGALDPSGQRIKVAAANSGSAPRTLVFRAIAANGLKAEIALTVRPNPDEAPAFSSAPAITGPADGKVGVQYTFPYDPELDDWSVVNWYRCDDAAGTNPVLVATTRANGANSRDTVYRPPIVEYWLNPSLDVGKFIRVEVTPRHSNSPAGTMVSAVTSAAITLADTRPLEYHLDFQGFVPVQTKVDGLRDTIAQFVTYGSWTNDAARPFEHENAYNLQWNQWRPASGWEWGVCNANAPLDQRPGIKYNTNGARLMYNPSERAGGYGDMDMTWVIDNEKGVQGFASATFQYIDIFFKFDPATGNGYALRIQRVGISGNSTAWGIMRYKGWNAYTDACYPAPLPEEVENDLPAVVNQQNPTRRQGPNWWTETRTHSWAFLPHSHIRIWTETAAGKTKVFVEAHSDGEGSGSQLDYAATVNYEWELPEDLNRYGGFGVWTTGNPYFQASANQATITLRSVDVDYSDN